MRKRLLTLFAFMVVAMGAFAALEEGQYYLYNQGAKKYLGAGNSWGTQASLLDHAEYVTIRVNEDGTYSVESQVSNGGENYFLGTNGYMDGGRANFNFTQVGGSSSVIYTISYDVTATDEDGNETTTTNYVGYDKEAESSVVKMDLTYEGAPDRNAQWKLYTDEDMLKELAKATETKGKDATWLILDPNFGRNNRNVGAWNKVVGNPNMSGGNNTNNNAESYMSAYEINQVLSEIPNGVYKLSGQGAVTYHDDRTIKEYDGEGAPVFFANEETSDYLEMEPIDQLSSMGQMSEKFTAGKYYVKPIYLTVTDGELTVGTKCERADIWAVWDNFELTYYGEEADINNVKFQGLVDQVADLRAEATALLADENITEVGKAALNEALEATANVEKEESALNEAIEKLNGAIAIAKAQISAAQILPKMKELVDATNFYTQEAYDAYYGAPAKKFEAGTLTVEEANALQDPTVVTGWHAALTVDNFLLSVWDTNPDFVDAPYYINSWSVEGNSDDSGMFVPFFEYWTGDGDSLGERTLTGTMEGIAAGDYDVTALVRVRAKNGYEAPAYGISMKVNDGEAVDAADGRQVVSNDGNALQFFVQEVKAKGTVAEDGILKAQFIVDADNNISWLSFKNVKYAPAQTVGISNVQEKVANDGIIYNLNGQKVQVAGKGLYIKNGKKYIVK